MINLDELDPNWEFAKIHGKASIVGKATKTHSQRKLCPCCLCPLEKEKLPLCDNSKQLEILGTGIPQFYVFVKSALILLFVMLFSYHVISLYFAFGQNYQDCVQGSESHHRLLANTLLKNPCTSFMIQMSRISKVVSQTQIVLRITSFIIHLGLLIYIRDTIWKLNQYFDERACTLSDYAVKLKYIPHQKGIKAKLTAFFKQAFSTSHQIKQTTLLPSQTTIEELKEEKQKKIDEMRPFYKNDETIVEHYSEIKDIKRQIAEINQKFQQALRELEIEADKDIMECESAILIFNTDREKQEIIEEFNKMEPDTLVRHFGEGAENISLDEAAEPKEIIWENMNLPKRERTKRKLIGWGLSLLVLVIVTVIFYFILRAKTELVVSAIQLYHLDPSHQQSRLDGAIALVYIMLFIVVLFNKLGMSTLFHYFTDLESHKTSSSFEFSFGLKYCLGLFFTTAIMTLLVEAITFNNYYIHEYGVIEEETVMFFLNAFFVPLFWLINPYSLKRAIERKLKFGRRDLTQREANQLMEEPEYIVGKRYAQIIETLWFTFLYASLIPFGAVLSFIGLILYYWVDKYNLLRRSTMHVQVKGSLTNLSVILLDFTLFFRVLGELIFDFQIRDGYHASTIVLLCISVVYLLLPMNQILKWLHDEKFNLEEKTYEEIKYEFVENYHTLHPTYYSLKKNHLDQKMVLKCGVSFWPESSKTLKTFESIEEDVV